VSVPIRPPLLLASHVTFRVNGRDLIDDVSLELASGSMTVLLGPNGAGKTTLIRLLAGIATATGGEITLGGHRLRDLSRSAIARCCAYLPQQTGARFELRVEDVVAQGRYPHIGMLGGFSPADYDRITWAMDRVGLSSLRQRLLPTLSGGERQRVFLARALAQEAPILLLDEPISALDIGRQLELMALLMDLNRDGHTILAALHDLRAALEFFPRTLLLHEGRLKCDGPTGSVLQGEAIEAAFGVRLHPGESFRLSPVGPTGTAWGAPHFLVHPK
jgi:iron complex transport system ATP-binding protein